MSEAENSTSRLPQVALVAPGVRMDTARALARALTQVELLFCAQEELTVDQLRHAHLVVILAGADGVDAAIGAMRRVLQLRRDALVLVLAERLNASEAAEIIRRGGIDAAAEGSDAGAALAVLVAKNLAAAEARSSERKRDQELQNTLLLQRQRIDELETEVLQLERMAWTDALTGLANRRQVHERLPQLFAEAVRYQTDLACMMVDLDGFKAINDTLGHTRGDDLLQATARTIIEEVRTADLAARYGGDEFLVLMPQTNCRTAALVAGRLSTSFHRRAAAGAGGVRCGMSIGVSCLSVSRPLDGKDLIMHADNALYAAKHDGKGRIMICGPDGVNCDVVLTESLAQ